MEISHYYVQPNTKKINGEVLKGLLQQHRDMKRFSRKNHLIINSPKKITAPTENIIKTIDIVSTDLPKI